MVGIEKGVKQIVAKIVVALGHPHGTSAGLAVAQPGRQRGDPGPGFQAKLLPRVVGENPADEFVNAAHVPPAVHVRLAQPQVALGKHPVPKTLVLDLNVLGTRSIHLNVGLLQNVA